MISRPLVKFVLTAALRDKLLITLLTMVVCGGALSVFLGGAAITEKESFSLVFGAAGLRFVSVIGIVLFCCFYIRRCFETKEVEFLLSRPISRLNFLFSHAAAFMILSMLLAVVVSGVVFFLGKPSPGGLAAWGISIGVENTIMAVAALFFSMVLSSAAGSALATLGLYALSRLVGTLLGIAALPPEKPAYAVLNNIMDLVSVVVPRLDMMGQTSWLVYGVEGSGGVGYLERSGAYAHMMMAHLGIVGFLSMQGVLFISLLLAAAAFDFLRRQF
jgi:ABC-type transport system involved in multi-copper enzyme maturation permease subunit